MNKPPQLMSGPQAIMDWLIENSQERTVETGMNVRAVPIAGATARDPFKMSHFWRQAAEQLPQDAAFVHWGDSQFVLSRPGTDRYYDVYLLLLASKEWPTISDGELIPEFEVLIEGEKITLQEPK